jgi:glycerol uptake facilitator protein
MWNIFIGEFIGTLVMILLGNGVVANVVLKKTKGSGSGWIVISFGWGFAVAISVYLVGYLSGAHLNPAVTLAFALRGLTSWSVCPIYLAGQFLGAFIGALLVWLTYYPHFKATEDLKIKRLCFGTEPAIVSKGWNALTEVVATAVLILGIFGVLGSYNELSSGLGPYLIGILVVAIGLSLGGPTGYAINPARDLGPRLAYSLLSGKGAADWGYAWVPAFAPLVGSVIGLALYRLLFP